MLRSSYAVGKSIPNEKINAPIHLAWEGLKLRMHDADSGSPTTERNRENVFQLILLA